MSLITRRIPHHTQPQRAVLIDRSNPHGVKFTSFMYPLGNRLFDACKTLNGASTALSSAPFTKGLGLEFNGTSSEINFGDVPSVDFAGAYSIFLLFRPDAQGGARREMLLAKDADTGRQFTVEINPLAQSGTTAGETGAIGHARFVTDSTYYQKYSAANVVSNGSWYSLLLGSTNGSSDIVAYLNGASLNLFDGSGSVTGLMQATATAMFAGRRDYPANFDYFDGGIAAIGIANVAPSADLAKLLFENPWQVLEPRKQNIFISAASGADLAGAAAAVATATATIAQSVPLAGASVTTATALGGLSISIPLAGAATVTASASGGLSLSIPLSGAAVAQALASAGITQATPLSGAATATAAASAGLSINVSLSGAAIAEAAAAAELTVATSGLAGSAAATATTSGALSISIPLAGAALTVASALGGITKIVPLTGSAAAASMATGGLDVSVRLSGAALAQALAAAGLTVEGGLSGAAQANAGALGTITLRVNLAGAAVVNAIAAGALASDGALSPTPGWSISATPRTWGLSATPRTWSIKS